MVLRRPLLAKKLQKTYSFLTFLGPTNQTSQQINHLLCSCFVQNHHACGQKWPTAALLSRMLLGLAPPPSGKKLQKPYCFFNFFGPNQPNPATNQPTTHKPTTHKPTPSIQHPLDGLDTLLPPVPFVHQYDGLATFRLFFVRLLPSLSIFVYRYGSLATFAIFQL